MHLGDFFDYKNQLAEDLLTSPIIVRLLNDDGRDIADPGELMYSQVFPYEYIPETTEHAQTYICCDVDVERVLSKTYLNPILYIWVFTHKSKMRLPEGGVRVDKIVSEISKLINGSRVYGLGTLDLKSSRRFAPIADYQGKVLTFTASEFNRPGPNSKEIPSNRKKGV